MADLAEHCPVCLKIKEGKIERAGDLCCTIKWADDVVAVLSEHRDSATVEETGEALDLLGYTEGKLVISDFEEAAGHWGLRSVSKTRQGSSNVGGE